MGLDCQDTQIADREQQPAQSPEWWEHHDWWEPDADNPSCQSCDAPFTLTRRHHHCRHCGNNVCHECSDGSALFSRKRRSRRCKCCSSDTQIYAVSFSPGCIDKFVIPSGCSLQKPLGSGSSGKVALVHGGNRAMVLKKISNVLRSSKSSELVLTHHLAHPHIVTQLPCFSRVHGSDLYVALETMDCDLGDALDCGLIEIDEEIISSWMEQLLSALAYIHALDVVHRDIREDNLLLNIEEGTLKLADFGLSKSVASMSTEEKALWKADDLTKACNIRSRLCERAGLDKGVSGGTLHDIYMLQAAPKPRITASRRTGSFEVLRQEPRPYTVNALQALKREIRSDLETAMTRDGVTSLLERYRSQRFSLQSRRRSGG